MYDLNGDSKIDKTELKGLLTAALKENMQDMQLTESQIDEIVQDTLKMVDRDGNGTVEYNEYHDMVVQSPSTVMKSYTLDISQLCRIYGQLRKTETKLSDKEIERRKYNLINQEKLKDDLRNGEKREAPRRSSVTKAPSDSEFDLNAQPVAERELSIIL